MTAVAGTATLRALVVCTGNVCRSPAAELLLRAGVGPGAGLELTSAGLSALAGEPVAPSMAQLLRGRGVDPAGFVARQLQPTDVRGADLVLTMTAAQRRSVVTAMPSAVRRTFTLVEFADVASLAQVDRLPGGPAARVAAALGAAPRARSMRAGTAPDDDVEDPYGRSEDAYLRAFLAIEAAVTRLLRGIGIAGSGRPGATRGDRGGHLPAATVPGGDGA